MMMVCNGCNFKLLKIFFVSFSYLAFSFSRKFQLQFILNLAFPKRVLYKCCSYVFFIWVVLVIYLSTLIFLLNDSIFWIKQFRWISYPSVVTNDISVWLKYVLCHYYILFIVCSPRGKCRYRCLTDLFPMHPFSTPWKHQTT